MTLNKLIEAKFSDKICSYNMENYPGQIDMAIEGFMDALVEDFVQRNPDALKQMLYICNKEI